MNTIKKILLISSTVIYGLLSVNSNIQASDDEQTTELTASESVAIRQYVDETMLGVLSADDCKYILSDAEDNPIKELTEYVLTETSAIDGSVISEQVINQYELLNYTLKNGSTSTRTTPIDIVETNMKKITLRFTNLSFSQKAVEIECKWLTIPKCKSYDLIGIRLTGGGITLDNNSVKNIYGTQVYDGKTIEYTSSSDNMKKSNTGYGCSMNIVNTVKNSLVMTLAIKYVLKRDTASAAGSYQHATKELDLKTSQKYDINFSGMGGVFDFKGNIASYYDNTPGLYIIGAVAEN